MFEVAVSGLTVADPSVHELAVVGLAVPESRRRTENSIFVFVSANHVYSWITDVVIFSFQKLLIKIGSPGLWLF